MATAVPATEAGHAFRIRRNHAITAAIAVVSTTSTANQRAEKRSGFGVVWFTGIGIQPTPTGNGAP